jgi:APA family basic amino acid/polyamine antiporter
MKLNKGLNLLDVFCISTGAMLSGLFILPGLAYAFAGPALLLSYGLAGFLALTGLLSQAELASAMPKAGGTYFYVTRSMGSAVGTVYGLITWLSMALKSAYELSFLAIFAGLVIHINPYLLVVVFCVIFLLINLFGVKEATRLQVFSVLVILVILVYFCLRSYPNIQAQNFQPFAPGGVDAVISAAGFIFISFGGLLKVASIAEEVKNPGRTLPLGMIFSLLVISILSVGVVFVAVAVLGKDLAGSVTPISDTASLFFGNQGRIMMGCAAVLAILTAANAGIMAASRYPLALARDGMLPDIFAKINNTFKTPHPSILVTGAVIIAACFFNITAIVKAASSVLILTYIFTCLAVIVLRESRVQNYRPRFRSPLYPWIQLVGLVGFTVLLFEMGLTGLFTICLLAVLGFLFYWFYGRKKTSQEYALLHLIERITARELTSHSLESELKDIIHERDEILKDRFDHLVEACPVLNIEGAVTAEEFFAQAADTLGRDLSISSDDILQLFLERERESSTVLNPFLAIPHIVIEGEHYFDLLLVRCKEGITFSSAAPKVHTVFVLIGSRDERLFHLMSLAAIAQIVQEDDFESRWMAAKGTEALRDIVLLGKRKRQK